MSNIQINKSNQICPICKKSFSEVKQENHIHGYFCKNCSKSFKSDFKPDFKNNKIIIYITDSEKKEYILEEIDFINFE
jgi:transposase-like protein